MANLNLKLEESKNESKAILMIECSNDVNKDIINSSKEIFSEELKAPTGNIIIGENSTKIQMILFDQNKIDMVKNWLIKRAMQLMAT